MRKVIASMGLFLCASATGLLGTAWADAPPVDRLFRMKCGSCHGADGKGDTTQGKKMKVADMTTAAWKKQFSDAQIKSAIIDGFNREKDGVKQEMKPWKGKLKDEEVAALVSFVRGLK